VEGRVERPFLNAQHVRRQRVNPLRDRIPVQRAGAEHAQDQKCQRTLRHVEFRHKIVMGIVRMPGPRVKRCIRFQLFDLWLERQLHGLGDRARLRAAERRERIIHFLFCSPLSTTPLVIDSGRSDLSDAASDQFLD